MHCNIHEWVIARDIMIYRICCDYCKHRYLHEICHDSIDVYHLRSGYNASIIVTPHLPQVGHGWGLLGICKSRLTNSPPLGPILCCKSPTFCIGTSKNNEDSWTNAPTLGTKYADKSLQIPTRCPTWGRWGLTMIGA